MHHRQELYPKIITNGKKSHRVTLQQYGIALGIHRTIKSTITWQQDNPNSILSHVSNIATTPPSPVNQVTYTSTTITCQATTTQK